MIDRDTIMHLANQAAGQNWGSEDHLQRFAALVAAAERDACAQVCGEQASRSETSMLKAKSVKTRDIYSAAGQTAHWMAQAIRARGAA